ncbi:hypothetical protein EOPP23_06590 [Endozoicomonas sp. OPT23]|uniref:type VI secretion system protein TssA n=1 Tax=Endozoicomonas sp. OPT23 TaxID=2072845 RepID=UPI00129A98B4|nr:type VI secretion system ImpA family N-terminal domain-containing protein [Endozoicomonas sp. OPT23]MRI32654.1 hypothetical protein [Endozoicomonas sp. OPT23]
MKIAQHLNELTQPIEGANPAGSYLKDDRSLYRPLRNSYNIAQTAFRKLTNNPPEDELDDLIQTNQDSWQELSSQLVDVIKHQSKDLECISWLTLAQMFSRDPYENLTACLHLMTSVVEQFGEQVQPRVPDNKLRAQDEAGKKAEIASLQLRPVTQVFGESEDTCLLSLPLRMLPLLSDIDYVSCRSAESQEQRAALQQRARQALGSEQSEVIARINAMGDAVEALDILEGALAAYSGACGSSGVSSRFLKKQLTDNLNAMQSLTEGVLVPWPLDARKQTAVVVEESDSEKNAENIESGASEDEVASYKKTTAREASAETGEQIFNRDQAFQQLRLIANYFARTEPQSPVSSMIEKVIRWGYTPLPDLINELVQGNDNLMGRISELTGMTAEKVHIPGVPAQGLIAPPQAASETSNAEAAPEMSKTEQKPQQEVRPEPPAPAVTAEPVAKTEESERSGIPAFVNLPSPREKKPAANKPTGPGGIDLASLGIR